MEKNVILMLCENLTLPTNKRYNIYCTARAVIYLTKIFTDIKIDTITLHSWLLHLAKYFGAFKNNKRYITCLDIAIYAKQTNIVSLQHIIDQSLKMDIKLDNQFNEIKDLHRITQQFQNNLFS